jgi:hypothetical protein
LVLLEVRLLLLAVHHLLLLTLLTVSLRHHLGALWLHLNSQLLDLERLLGHLELLQELGVRDLNLMGEHSHSRILLAGHLQVLHSQERLPLSVQEFCDLGHYEIHILVLTA